MLLFNKIHPTTAQVVLEDFNTSNVTIQQSFLFIIICKKHYFNTSNVTIQPELAKYAIPVTKNFNTSNVTIQPTILSHLFYSQFHYTHYISTFL